VPRDRNVLQAPAAGTGELTVSNLQPLQDGLQAVHEGGSLVLGGHGSSVDLGAFYAVPGRSDGHGGLDPAHGPQGPMTSPVNMGRVTLADLGVHIPCGNPNLRPAGGPGDRTPVAPPAHLGRR